MLEHKENKQMYFARTLSFIELKRFFFPFLVIFLMLLPVVSSPKKNIKIFFPNGFSLNSELAVTNEERQLGLMFRDKINYDQAMLFVFEEEGFHSFWMKNMKFSIDILWLDREKRIVHLETNVPPCKKSPCPSYPALKPAMFVLEIKAGSVHKHQLKLYDRIEFVLPKLRQYKQDSQQLSNLDYS